MKRITILLLTIITLALSASAEYDRDPAPTETIWDEDDQQFICRLKRNDPPRFIFERFGGYTQFGGREMGDFQVVGQHGYSKNVRIVVGQLVYGGVFDFCQRIGESWSTVPIKIQMKDKKIKLTGTCRCKGVIIKGDVVKNAWGFSDEYPEHHKLARIWLSVSFDDLHCKGEPDPNSLEHETFIAKAISSSDIKTIELGNGAYKFKLDPFHSMYTMREMLKTIAECTDEMSIYFPNYSGSSTNKTYNYDETKGNNNNSIGNLASGFFGSY